MFARIFLLCVFVWAASAAIIEKAADPLFISSFNVQVFGKSKMSKPQVVAILVQIVKRYDLIMIQEIRDIDQVAFPDLVKQVNDASGPNEQYGSLLGPRVGRTSSKEQYGFIYRLGRVRPLAQYEYDDKGDVFEREPYVVQFEKLTSGSRSIFNLIPLHAKPDDAVREINALIPVYDDSVSRTSLFDSLITGDLNADCSYVCKSCWEDVDLRHDSRFNWMINDDADTTVSTTDCAYDRIITTGSLTAYSHGATVFDFEKAYGLSYEEAKDVSDHYPVEFYLD